MILPNQQLLRLASITCKARALLVCHLSAQHNICDASKADEAVVLMTTTIVTQENSNLEDPYLKLKTPPMRLCRVTDAQQIGTIDSLIDRHLQLSVACPRAASARGLRQGGLLGATAELLSESHARSSKDQLSGPGTHPCFLSRPSLISEEILHERLRISGCR